LNDRSAALFSWSLRKNLKPHAKVAKDAKVEERRNIPKEVRAGLDS
jgi:hypothetical protein